MRGLREPIAAFAVATLLVAALGALARVAGPVASNLGALVAVVFLAVPYAILARRREDLHQYGFRAAPLRQGWLLGLGAPLIIFPLFVGCYVVFYEAACAADAPGWLATLTPPGQCLRWDGLAGAHLPDINWFPRFDWPASHLFPRLAPGGSVTETLATQLIVVALPEELFFRGYIHKMCERALPPKRRWWGGGVGWALILSSALFAIGHLAVNFDLRRLAVFFPGLLFGWMRSKTDSVFAGVIAHALSNLLIFNLDRIFF